MMRKAVYFLILIFVICFGTTSCIKTDNNYLDLSSFDKPRLDTIVFTHSMKGWELYSWPIGSNWKYSLMVGTNSVKTYSSITNNHISVTGEDSLKLLLSRLPYQEEVFWIGKDWLAEMQVDSGEIQLPPRSIQIDIKEFCDNHNLRLIIKE
jgi:hypothetical protein